MKPFIPLTTFCPYPYLTSFLLILNVSDFISAHTQWSLKTMEECTPAPKDVSHLLDWEPNSRLIQGAQLTGLLLSVPELVIWKWNIRRCLFLAWCAPLLFRRVAFLEHTMPYIHSDILQALYSHRNTQPSSYWVCIVVREVSPGESPTAQAMKHRQATKMLEDSKTENIEVHK